MSGYIRHNTCVIVGSIQAASNFIQQAGIIKHMTWATNTTHNQQIIKLLQCYFSTDTADNTNPDVASYWNIFKGSFKDYMVEPKDQFLL